MGRGKAPGGEHPVELLVVERDPHQRGLRWEPVLRCKCGCEREWFLEWRDGELHAYVNE